MSVIPFPSQIPDYSGRILTLNQEKIRRFQCGGFSLGPKNSTAVVPPDAQMGQIHQAILDGRLLDVTDSSEVESKTSGAHLLGVRDEDVGKKAYFVRTEGGELAMVVPETEELKEQLEAAAAGKSKLVLPEGFGDEEKYLLKLSPEQ